MKKRTSIAIIVASALFVVLFAARLVEELSESASPVGKAYAPMGAMNQDSISRSKFNYASEKISVPQGAASGGSPQVIDQKYERVADLRLESSAFEEDSARVRELAAAASAVVQSENAYGLPGSRSLSLKLGVVPEAFDATVEWLKAVGKLVSITVTKTDKTADFRALEAKRQSLEKTRDGLKSLRTAGADLSDLVALETKILEIDEQIQELGVSLGDFSEDNSLCTIEISISEVEGASASRVLSAVLAAIGWALLVELGVAVLALAAAATAALAALAYEKYRKARAA